MLTVTVQAAARGFRVCLHLRIWGISPRKLDKASGSQLPYDLWVVLHSFQMLSLKCAMPKAVNIVVLGGSSRTPAVRHCGRLARHSKQCGLASQSEPSSGAYNKFTNDHWLVSQAASSASPIKGGEYLSSRASQSRADCCRELRTMHTCMFSE